MNDPHVVALHYNIDHDPSIAFDKAKPLDHRETAFDVRVEDKKARFTFKEHHATAKAARAAVEEFIRAWEFEAALQRGANAFTLRYHHADIEDRNPTPGVVTVSPMPATFLFRTGKASGVVSPPSYPSPPSMPLKVSPDVQSMHDHFLRYLDGRETLTSMAYFCLTVLEASTRKSKEARRAAAEQHGIDEAILDKIGRLSSTKGGTDARKASGLGHALDHKEKRFLEAAIKAIIRRSAEVAANPGPSHTTITLSDLPPV